MELHRDFNLPMGEVTALAVSGVCFLSLWACEGSGWAAEGSRDRRVSVWSDRGGELLQWRSRAAQAFTARFTGHCHILSEVSTLIRVLYTVSSLNNICLILMSMSFWTFTLFIHIDMGTRVNTKSIWLKFIICVTHKKWTNNYIFSRKCYWC